MFNLACAFSALLLVIVVLGWVRSYGDVERLWFRSGYDGDRRYVTAFLFSCDGELFFEWERIRFDFRPAPAPETLVAAEDGVGLQTPALRNFGWVDPLGFDYFNTIGRGCGGTISLIGFVIPYWFLAVRSLVLPVTAGAIR